MMGALRFGASFAVQMLFSARPSSEGAENA